MGTTLYRQIQQLLTKQIQQGAYHVGDYLPSDNELCRQNNITWTTVRKALEELQRNSFIERHQGKGSRVVERRKSLGLLNVKGFSEAVGKMLKPFFFKFRASEHGHQTFRSPYPKMTHCGDVFILKGFAV